MSADPAIRLSALVVAHNEEAQLADCLDTLGFADEIVVVLDKCTDRSKEIAARYTDRLVEGAWAIEGERRNTGIAACRGAINGLMSEVLEGHINLHVLDPDTKLTSERLKATKVLLELIRTYLR